MTRGTFEVTKQVESSQKVLLINTFWRLNPKIPLIRVEIDLF